MQRLLGLTLIAAAVLTGCGSPDRQDARSEGADQPDSALPVAMDTASAHDAHAVADDPHAGHVMAPTADQDPHAGHGAPSGDAAAAGAGNTQASDEGHAGHVAPGGVGAATVADRQAPDAHAAHAPTGQARQADQHAGHAVTPQAAGQTADSHPRHAQPSRPSGATNEHTAHEAARPNPSHAEHQASPRLTDPAAHRPADPATPGGTRLALLVDALLEDPAVMQRIQQNPDLREMWGDPAVSSALRPAPETSDPMAKLLELVRALTADPAVQDRIQEDATLRRLQSHPSVRQRIQPTGQP